jgi:hypothetical protein
MNITCHASISRSYSYAAEEHFIKAKKTLILAWAVMKAQTIINDEIRNIRKALRK